MQSYAGDVALNVYDSTVGASAYFAGFQHRNVFAWAFLGSARNKEGPDSFVEFMDNTSNQYGGPNVSLVLPSLPKLDIAEPVSRFQFEPEIDVAQQHPSPNTMASQTPTSLPSAGVQVEPPSASTRALSPTSAISGLFDPPSGFRKGLSVADLRPQNAPTKPRTYRTQGKTTPRGIQLQASSSGSVKRARDASDDLVSPPSSKRAKATVPSQPSTPAASTSGAASLTEQERLERKRIANTLAQRRSRQRKQETVESLQAEVEELRRNLQLKNAEIAQVNQKKAANKDSILRDKEKEQLLMARLIEYQAIQRNVELRAEEILGETAKLKEENERLLRSILIQ